jgi:hypothetical protein
MEALFGDVQRYVSLLDPVVVTLKREYCHEDLRPIFRSLPERSIAIAPMALCDRLAHDLGTTVSDNILRGIGALCLPISTHDDLVDELPKDRKTVAALVYAGNIAALEGVRLIAMSGHLEVLHAILTQVNKNHLFQQYCVTRLWEHAPLSFEEYREGIEHDCVFASIGIFAALALARAMDRAPQLWSFCVGYGVAFQLLDDIAEVAEDRVAGYHSFPLLEGAPFDESFRKIFVHLDAAERALDPKCKQLRELLTYPRAFAENLRHAMPP